jgi:hypothetical protein
MLMLSLFCSTDQPSGTVIEMLLSLADDALLSAEGACGGVIGGICGGVVGVIGGSCGN